VAPGVFLTGGVYTGLARWVERYYRERLAPDDLADPRLLDESRRALDELTVLLGLGRLYRFQGATVSAAV
jgi:succinylarginine dihydrolase